MKRRVCVVTSSRADYNHLYTLMHGIKKSTKLNLSIIVTGMHTIKEHGLTYKEIIKDGFEPDAIIKSNQASSSTKDVLKGMSVQLNKTYNVLSRIKPDIVVVLGDRYDMYIIALASHIMKIPIAHFHGGEVTTGVIDDALRHSVSKFSDIHFVADKTFKNRLIQLGESKSKIFNYGSLGIDAINQIKFKKRSYLNQINKNLSNDKYFVISIHPETLNNNNEKLITNTLLSLNNYKEYSIIFSHPNSDPGSLMILKKIRNYVKHNDNCFITPSFGRYDYLHLLKYSEALIGNSSSGILEAPSLSIPSVNIGTRQNGRPRCESVIDSGISFKSINNSIKKALNIDKNKINPQYKGKNMINKVLTILEKTNLVNIKSKEFSDIL